MYVCMYVLSCPISLSQRTCNRKLERRRAGVDALLSPLSSLLSPLSSLLAPFSACWIPSDGLLRCLLPPKLVATYLCLTATASSQLQLTALRMPRTVGLAASVGSGCFPIYRVPCHVPSLHPLPASRSSAGQV